MGTAITTENLNTQINTIAAGLCTNRGRDEIFDVLEHTIEQVVIDTATAGDAARMAGVTDRKSGQKADAHAVLAGMIVRDAAQTVLMQLLKDARNSGTLPAIIANAVNDSASMLKADPTEIVLGDLDEGVTFCEW